MELRAVLVALVVQQGLQAVVRGELLMRQELVDMGLTAVVLRPFTPEAVEAVLEKLEQHLKMVVNLLPLVMVEMVGKVIF